MNESIRKFKGWIDNQPENICDDLLGDKSIWQYMYKGLFDDKWINQKI